MQTIHFGIIGAGLMGREFASAAARWCHLLDIRARPEIIVVCDQNPAALEWFTSSVPTVACATKDYRQLLADPRVDAVYCAVPHHLHEKIYIDTLRAGKHLLGEKPFGIDRRANQAILDEAARRPALMVRGTSEFPFFPAVQRIVRYAREGRLGKILEVEAGFLHSSDMDPRKPLNWKRMVAFNGAYGCMGDLGMHVLHVPLRLGWAPRNVRAILSNIVTHRNDANGELQPCETWDNATLLCEVEADDCHFPMTLKTQRIAPGETNTWYFTVKGTRLSARFTTRQPRTLWTMPYQPGDAQAWHEEAVGYESLYRTITGGIFEFGFTDAIQQMIAAYCDEIVQGGESNVPFACVLPEETRLQHAILEAALESHVQTRVVSLSEADEAA